MLKRGFYLWRLVWTPLAFAALGVGGVVLALTAIPAATLFVRDEQARNRRAQSIIRESFRLYLWFLQAIGILKLEVIGGDQIQACRGTLVIANHPTLIDIVILMALLPDAKCVGKRQLWRNPMLRMVVRAAGYIRNDHEPEILLEKCRESLQAGYNLIIFPEGTRSVPGQTLRFQRGFAHIAIASGADLRLVLITCEPVTLVKGRSYYKIPDSPPHFRIEVGEQINAASYMDRKGNSRSLRARHLVSYVESNYSRRLNHV
ncbi:MAG: 1-acyl-sn-glycerol-3-phosphate acyltransferase [Candidatus Binataceae bacterium]|nr:1-acyl-sn-glycerol-3-phosphate acyltransferase [Candidatus Binataceae bacterium]